MAETIENKKELEIIKTVSKDNITEYLGLGVDRILVIKEGDTMIMLNDQTRIVVPTAIRETLLDREYLSDSGINRISTSIRAKYFWLGIEGKVKRMVESCEASQMHKMDQQREPNRPALEYVSCSMQAFLGCRHGGKYRHRAHCEAAEDVVCNVWRAK